jgi:hypothetical protein
MLTYLYSVFSAFLLFCIFCILLFAFSLLFPRNINLNRYPKSQVTIRLYPYLKTTPSLFGIVDTVIQYDEAANGDDGLGASH